MARLELRDLEAATITPSTGSASTSPKASSWSCSARRAAERPRRCAWLRASSSLQAAPRAHIGGVDVTYLPPWRRNTGMVFQSYALFPHKPSRKAWPSASRCASSTKRRSRRGARGSAARATRGFSERGASALRRAAAARGARPRPCPRPDVLLLDEPLSNLDAKDCARKCRIEIRELQRQLGLTTVVVTHDQEEGADGRRPARCHGGRRDSPNWRPARSLRAAGGPLRRRLRGAQRTFLDGRVAAPGDFRTAGGLRLKAATHGISGPASLALRPERLSHDPANRLDNRLPGKVEFVSYLGAVLELRAPVARRPGPPAAAQPRRCGGPGGRRRSRGRLAPRSGAGLRRMNEPGLRRRGTMSNTNWSVTRRDALKHWGSQRAPPPCR